MQAVKITHDAFVGEEHVVNQTEDVSIAERVGADGYHDSSRPQSGDTEMVERFKEYRRDLASVCAPFPDYGTAAEMLGFDPDVANVASTYIYHPKHHKDRVRFVPKVHQIISTAWALEQELTPLGGGINAMDCGLGKTSQSFLLILQSGLQRLRQYKAFQ